MTRDDPDDRSRLPVPRDEASAVANTDEVGRLVERLTGDEQMGRAERGRLLGRLSAVLTSSARGAGAKGLAGGRWLTDVFVNQVAPRISVRDARTLRRHHHELGGEALADALVSSATNVTTAVGAAGGGLSAVEFAAPPLLLSAPAQVVAESLVVAAVEVKLVGELHEVYGARPPGGAIARTRGYVVAWGQRRGIDPLRPGTFNTALGAATRTVLHRRLLRLLGRHLSTLGPFLTGAVAGGALNRQATRRLGRSIRADLRRTSVAGRTAPDELESG